jgi:hypothetical protein
MKRNGEIPEPAPIDSAIHGSHSLMPCTNIFHIYIGPIRQASYQFQPHSGGTIDVPDLIQHLQIDLVDAEHAEIKWYRGSPNMEKRVRKSVPIIIRATSGM